MKTRTKLNIWLWVLVCFPFLIASCDHDVHEGKEDNGLSVYLTWQDEADQTTKVKEVRLWIFDADKGSLVEEKRYGSAQELANERFLLPIGHYHILSTVNLIEPFVISDVTNSLSRWDNIQIGLTNANDVEANAYFGVTDVNIASKESNYLAKIPVKSVLAELSILIENVPQGTEMSGKVLDAAQYVFPTQKDGDGGYGLASLEPFEVNLPTILAKETTIQSEVTRLMPTIQGSSVSHIYLRLLLPNNTPQEYDITAPTMKTGGKYELRLKYNEMQPKMNLDATINNWKDLNNEVEIK